MAFLQIPNVAIRGMAACVPSEIEENASLAMYSPEEALQIIESTGIERKHIAPEGVTASDLCVKAAERLIDELGWGRETIDAIGYFTQMPDYINHPTVFVAHQALGLSEECACYDYYHGCPGWLVSLSSMASLISNGSVKRVLLLGGDCNTKRMYKSYREERPLFGDCGTATALEFDSNAKKMSFVLGTKSTDGIALARLNGGERNPYTIDTFRREMDLRSGKTTPDETVEAMDGMSVFSFGITSPPKSVKTLCEKSVINIDGIDKLVLHQANLFMLKKIAKKLKVDMDKVPSSLRDFGNTTSASIPLTIISQCRKEYQSSTIKTVACSFGTGLAWGSVYFETDKIVCPEVIQYKKDV